MQSDLQCFETASSRMPPGTAARRVVTKDGAQLRALSVPAGDATPRGTVVIMNGRAEFLERYYETARDLARRGYHVVSFDWRGQGGSSRMLKDRARGYITSFRQHDEDLRAIMETVVLPDCPKPYYALAHSTGGHILLRNLSNTNWFRRAVITSPLVDFRYGKWPPFLAYLLSNMALAAGLGWAYLPGYKKGPFLLSNPAENPLTSDLKRWSRDKQFLEEHPELGVGGPTFAWLSAAMRSLKQVAKQAPRKGLNCPVMIVLAGREKVVDNRATQRLVEKVPGVSLVTINTALHEILMENDAIRTEFFAAFDSYTEVSDSEPELTTGEEAGHVADHA